RARGSRRRHRGKPRRRRPARHHHQRPAPRPRSSHRTTLDGASARAGPPRPAASPDPGRAPRTVAPARLILALTIRPSPPQTPERDRTLSPPPPCLPEARRPRHHHRPFVLVLSMVPGRKTEVWRIPATRLLPRPTALMP